MTQHAIRHGGSTMGQLYLSAFKAYPEDRSAIVSDSLSFTYGELARRVYRLARLFVSQGLKSQDAIAFLVSNRADAVAAIIAAQFVGLRNVALHPMASEEDHSFVLQNAGVQALVVDGVRYADRARSLVGRGAVARVLPLDDGELGLGLGVQCADMDDAEYEPASRYDDVTKIAYTGGTTGRPKGILHTHRTTVTMVQHMLATYEWPQEVRYLAATPISHAAGSLLLPVLLRGGAIYLHEKYSAEDFMSRVRQYRINLSFLVPTQIYGLLDHPGLAQADLSSLELILYGASPIAPSRLRQAVERIGPVFGQIYGQAESPMTISYLNKRDHDLARPNRLASCGRPIAGNQVKLLDSALNEAPRGEVGEICVRSPLVMDGYLNRPEEDAKVFAGDWLHTGDMAWQDEEGYLYLVDRAKDMIITGGFNVYPSEVEGCLAQHPAIAMSAVIGVPDAKWGEAVTAIVVLKSGSTLAVEEVIGHVMALKGAVNTPKTVIFAPELPLTALGKIDRKTLRKQYWSGQDRQIS